MPVSFRCATMTLSLLVVAPARGLTGQQAPASPPANPADVSSVDAIMAAVYDVISGPAGQKRNWDRFRSLFVPGARLIPAVRQEDGSTRAVVLTPEDYITRSARQLEERGFFEREIHRVTEAYGDVVHVFSTYESRRTLADPQPFTRGINSFQLMKDGNRWWVVTIFWFSERPDVPIPPRYLPAPRQ